MPQVKPGILAAAAKAVLGVALLCAAAVAEENLYSGSHKAANERYPGRWVFYRGHPGPDLPRLGRSAFDLLFTADGPNGRVYDVPYPFATLISRIRTRLPPDDRSGFSSLKTTLIPIGRSLQRNDAAPDFFRYPRIVVAVDTESRGLPYLKDRLFLGYQEKSNQIEVISYNETAGRFEFQIVVDYAPGQRPKVRYAERTVCISCHQNGAPIFSEAPWSETNSSLEISNRLLQHNTDFHGVPVESAGGAAFIDAATNRANLFSVYQLLWREGCADSSAPTQARRCRAGALVAMLQLRLSAFPGFNDQAVLYRDYFVPVAASQWRRRWAAGLVVPNADIPDRIPSLENASAGVVARFDPLSARPPGANWSVKRNLNRMITGLSDFIPAHDIVRLDDYLFERGLEDGAENEDFEGPCSIAQQDTRRGGKPVNFECQLQGAVSGRHFDLVGDVVFEPDWTLSSTINWLTISDRTGFASLALSGTPIRGRQGHWSIGLDLYQRENGLHARLANGNSLVALQLRWPITNDSPLPFPGRGEILGNATLKVMQDFSRVDDAIAGMLGPSAGDQLHLFDNEVFQGTKFMAAIFSELGMDASEHCCDLSQMPLPEVANENSVGGAGPGVTSKQGGTLETFYRFCGACHGANSRRPPGFLFGTEEKQIRANLRHCAQRILYRLQMWHLEHQRPKSPMPPISRLQAFNYSPDDWRQSPELSRMSRHVVGLLEGELGRVSGPQQLLDTHYSELPSCLP